MMIVEYSPDKVLTGILRLTVQVIRALSQQTDLYLLLNLPHPNYEVPAVCQVKFLKRNSIHSDFDEDLIQELASLPDHVLKRSSIKNATIFFPRWRPRKRFFRKEVGVIFDCSPVHRGYDFNDSNTRYFLKHLESCARLNDLTITISDFSFAEVTQLVDFKNLNLKRIYPGPSFDPAMLNRMSLVKRLKPSLNPYCIFIGSLDPRKGIFEILAWWNANGAELGFQKLILVGGVPSWATEEHQVRIRHALNTHSGVEHLGRVPDSLVLQLLTKASLCLYPSKYEGFGLPVCDALFAGVDVLTSGQSSTKEFGSAGAILVDPEKPWDWSKALAQKPTTEISFNALNEKYAWRNYADEILAL